MRIKLYRIFYLITLILVAVIGLFFSITTIIEAMKNTEGNNINYFINVGVFLIGVCFLSFEIITVIKSFTYGTQIFNMICFTERKTKNKITITVCTILSILSLFTIVWFTLVLAKINSFSFSSFTTSDNEFFIFLGLIFFVNVFFILIYEFTMQFSDISK